MKKKLISVFALLVIFLITGFNYNCKKQGTIIGYDINRCACCGGYEIQVGERIFLTDSIPKGILERDPYNGQIIYPTDVFLEYEHEKYCSSMRIIIT